MPKIELTPAQKRQLLIGAGIAIGVLAWLLLFLMPQIRTFQERRLQLMDLKQKWTELQEGLAQLPQIEGEIATLNEKYPQPEAEVDRPPQEQLPELLNTLGQLARREQVVLQVLKPTSDINKLSPGLSGYLELQIFVVVSGGYHQIGKFLDTVESSKDLLVRIQEFGIADDDESLWTHGGYILFQAYLAPGSVTGTSP